jgi:hypothetical protein
MTIASQKAENHNRFKRLRNGYMTVRLLIYIIASDAEREGERLYDFLYVASKYAPRDFDSSPTEQQWTADIANYYGRKKRRPSLLLEAMSRACADCLSV